ncbi:hypothetical protein B0T10DRAFT_605455 [Thelonectria olida]|uniref:Uncharacterized protein n=1 Tax=Thelonectria olida TaxID=1576542 RepID=A0A9P9ARE6_9HYPO|nr:hypothetical protein B0T10DRAFT_605455 [Thelonectria olida]
MPGKPGGTPWESAEFLMDLSLSLFVVAQATGGLSQHMRDAMVVYLQQQGHNTTWEAIRQHVQKLRRNRDTTAITAAVGGANSGGGTPAKPPARKRKAAGTPKKKKVAAPSGDDTDDEKEFLKREDDSEGPALATPEPKRAKKNVKPEPKEEPKEVNLDDYILDFEA